MAKSQQDGTDYLTLSDHLQDLRNCKSPWERLVNDVQAASSQKKLRSTQPSRKSRSDKGVVKRQNLGAGQWKKIEAHLRAKYNIGPYELAFKMGVLYPTLKNWRAYGMSLDKYGDRLKELGIDYELLI